MGKHYVPQEYLRGFADRDQPESVWTFVRDKPVPDLLPIKVVAQSRDFYPGAVEKYLAEHIEGPANPLLRKLRVGDDITDSERPVLSVYIATMLTRVPKHRERVWGHVPAVLDSTVSELREHVQGQAAKGRLSPERVEAIHNQIAKIYSEYQSGLPQQLVDQILDPVPSPTIVNLVNALAWRVVIAAEPEFFITTDNPAFYHSGHGLGTPQSELRLPLSPTHALHGMWTAAPRTSVTFHRVPKEWVREFNRSLASEASRLLFCHRNAAWMTKILNNRKPRLNRLVWTE